MNYSRIKLVANEKKILIKTIYGKLGLTRQGFDHLIKSNNLKISDLELISKILKVPVTFWFDEKDNLLEDMEKLNLEIKKLKNELLECHRELSEIKRNKLNLNQSSK